MISSVAAGRVSHIAEMFGRICVDELMGFHTVIFHIV